MLASKIRQVNGWASGEDPRRINISIRTSIRLGDLQEARRQRPVVLLL